VHVHLRDPIPDPPQAEPDACLHLHAPVVVSLRAQFSVRIPGRSAPALDTRQARLPGTALTPVKAPAEKENLLPTEAGAQGGGGESMGRAARCGSADGRAAQ
jgi:hypothetical protein